MNGFSLGRREETDTISTDVQQINCQESDYQGQWKCYFMYLTVNDSKVMESKV